VRTRRTAVIAAVAVVAVAVVASVAVVAFTGSGSGVAAPSPDIGVALNSPVPAAVAELPLTDQQGRTVDLAQLRGKVVLVAPFMTSCQEECPITTAALLAMQRSLDADGLHGKAVILEVTVDPARDTPQRMAAYAELTGSSWPLLTGSAAQIATFWHHFGIWYQKVPEDSPPGIDWQTGRPYTYDVNHSDGFVLIDQRGHERFVAGGMVSIDHLPRQIGKLLDGEGKSNLEHPGGGAWTVADGLDAIGWVLGQPVGQA
jgi:protein SCO1